MENNQHSNGGKAAADNQSHTSFPNSQPGQQLPPENNRADVNSDLSNVPEQHSESSRPENENETLGTP